MKDGLRHAREGKTKDFNAVCDRLEKVHECKSIKTEICWWNNRTKSREA